MTGLRRMLRAFFIEGISASVLCFCLCAPGLAARSEEHTSELQSR